MQWVADIDNRLSLHLGKTEAMLCGTKRIIKNRERFGVKCKFTPIETVTEVKYLGVKIDETLSGEGILDTIVRKCASWWDNIIVQTGEMFTMQRH